MGVGVGGVLLDVREGLVTSVLGVGLDDDGGGGRVGCEVGGGGGGLDVGGGGGGGFDVGVGGSVGLEVGGSGGEGLDVGGNKDVLGGGGKVDGIGPEVGTGLDDETGGAGFEDDGMGGRGLEEEIGGIGLVVGNGGNIVVLKTGGGGRKVGKLNVGTGGRGLEDDEIGGIGLVVGPGGRTMVVLRTGGEGRIVGMLSDGRLSVGTGLDGEMGSDGPAVGRLKVGRLSDGSGREVGKGGSLVEFQPGNVGLIVGRVSVGNPVELNTGGGGGGRRVGKVNVGIGGRWDVVEFKTGVVGIPTGMLGDRIDEVRRSDVRETFTLGSGRDNEGTIVGSDNDGSDSVGRDNEGKDKDGNNGVVGLKLETGAELEREALPLGTGGRVGRRVGRVTIGGEGRETVGRTTEGLFDGPPKLRDAEAEENGSPAEVEGRGIPEGRLQVRFCPIAMLDRPSNARETLTSILAVVRYPSDSQSSFVLLALHRCAARDDLIFPGLKM